MTKNVESRESNLGGIRNPFHTAKSLLHEQIVVFAF